MKLNKQKFAGSDMCQCVKPCADGLSKLQYYNKTMLHKTTLSVSPVQRPDLRCYDVSLHVCTNAVSSVLLYTYCANKDKWMMDCTRSSQKPNLDA